MTAYVFAVLALAAVFAVALRRERRPHVRYVIGLDLGCGCFDVVAFYRVRGDLLIAAQVIDPRSLIRQIGSAP